MADLYRPLDYLALPLSNVYAFADAEPIQRSNAVMLAFYCAQVLNHGVMVGAGQWTPWQWVTRVRIAAAPGADAPGLWAWQGDDLHVLCYDVTYEQKCLARRSVGKAAVDIRWGNRPRQGGNTSVNTDVYTDVIQVKESKDNNKEGVGNATAVRTDTALPAPTQEKMDMGEFRSWLAALCQAHPSARKSRVLGKDVQQAASEAYQRCPWADKQAGLLRAYLDDRLQEDRYRKPYYRPVGQRKFFVDLEDVITHAERWARETRWKPGRGSKGTTPAGNNQVADKAPEDVQSYATDEEVAAEIKAMRENT